MELDNKKPKLEPIKISPKFGSNMQNVELQLKAMSDKLTELVSILGRDDDFLPRPPPCAPKGGLDFRNQLEQLVQPSILESQKLKTQIEEIEKKLMAIKRK